MSDQRRCLDCGALFGKPHEVWCQSPHADRERAINARRELNARSDDPLTNLTMHEYNYVPSKGPLPVMLTKADLQRMARIRAEQKRKKT